MKDAVETKALAQIVWRRTVRSWADGRLFAALEHAIHPHHPHLHEPGAVAGDGSPRSLKRKLECDPRDDSIIAAARNDGGALHTAVLMSPPTIGTGGVQAMPARAKAHASHNSTGAADAGAVDVQTAATSTGTTTTTAASAITRPVLLPYYPFGTQAELATAVRDTLASGPDVSD